MRSQSRPATASVARRSSAICIVIASSQASPAGPSQWVARRGRYARKGARPGRARSLLHRALVPLARSEDPPEEGGKFLSRVTTHTDICMIHFPAEISRYRFAPECPELSSWRPDRSQATASGTPSKLVQSSVVNEDQKATVCDLRWRPSHEYDRCGGFVLAPESLEIDPSQCGLVSGAAIPAKGAGRSPRAVVDRALGADLPRKGVPLH